MESIKSINSYNQNNQNNHYQGNSDLDNSSENDNQTFDLAEVLKTGYQKRKFLNTSTLNWLKTWRVSNL